MGWKLMVMEPVKRAYQAVQCAEKFCKLSGCNMYMNVTEDDCCCGCYYSHVEHKSFARAVSEAVAEAYLVWKKEKDNG